MDDNYKFLDHILRRSSLGSFYGGIGGGLGSLIGLSNYQDPTKAAIPYFNQIPGLMERSYNPYITMGSGSSPQLSSHYQQLLNQGSNVSNQFSDLMRLYPELAVNYRGMSGAIPKVQGEYDQLISDPTAIMSKIGSTYQSSPGYKFQTQQALDAANRSAAAGGRLGTPSTQQGISNVVNQLANQDYDKYLNQGLGLYGTGLQGLGQLGREGVSGMSNLFGTGLQGMTGLYGKGLSGMEGLYNTGFDASRSLADNLASSLSSQGMLNYESAMNRNLAKQQGWGGAFGGLADIGLGLSGLGGLKGLTGLF